VIANERLQTRHEHTIDCPAFDADRCDTGRPLFLRQLGKNGPLLAFLPGIGATTRYWKLVVGSLANRMRLVLVDFLGFGRTPKNRGPRIRSIGMSPSCIACLRQWHCNSRSRWSGTHWARGSR